MSEVASDGLVLRDQLRRILAKRRFRHGLDVGAGHGRLSGVLAERCEQLTLLDSSPNYEIVLQAQYPDASVLVGSILDYDFAASHDLILLAHVLYYIEPDQRLPLLQRLYDNLVPPGVLLVSLVNCDEIFNTFASVIPNELAQRQVIIKQFQEAAQTIAPVEIYTYESERVFAHESEIIEFGANFFAVPNEIIATAPEQLGSFIQQLDRMDGCWRLLMEGETFVFKK